MRNLRGFTMVEVVMASALTVVVVGAMAYMFHFAARTAANVSASANTTFQAQLLANELTRVIRNSVSCSTVTSGSNTGLRCTMPFNGTDFDGDGYNDSYTPIGVSKRGIEKYGTGKRVWFYMSDSTGLLANTGALVWRAQRNDNSTPVAGDRDTAFPYDRGTTNSRWNTIESVTFSVDSANRTTTFTIVSSQLSRARRTASSADVNSGAGFRTTLTRTVFWGNWHQ